MGVPATAPFVIPEIVFSRLPVVIGLRPCGYRDELDGWVRDQGFETFVTDEGREAVEWVRRTPRALSFLDHGLARVDGEEVWRVVRRVALEAPDGVSDRSAGRGSVRGSRLVLMAAKRSNELWVTALAEGVGALLPLPTERDVVLTALRVAGRI